MRDCSANVCSSDLSMEVLNQLEQQFLTLGLRAITPYFYDGHTFMVPAHSGVTKAAELDGATICLLQGTTNEQITADFFRKSDLSFTPVVFERSEQARDALDSGRCDRFGSDSGNPHTSCTTGSPERSAQGSPHLD